MEVISFLRYLCNKAGTLCQSLLFVHTRCWIDIATTINDVDVTGSYSLDNDGWMTVRMNGGAPKLAHGGPAAEGVARMILRELYGEANRATE
ncbi:hypothetical protein [Paraburkholderia sp. MM6662-R1]|uniref:hypothetical protein n=1 Tax=Paraburkholderia sp. MM6662-R1 TaxID=2991066 RepID=UPI003D1BA4F0